MKHLNALAASTVLCLSMLPDAGWSNGNHYGWCNGVGNQHEGTGCGAGGVTQAPSLPPAQVPTSNQLPLTAPQLPPTPTAVTTNAIVLQPLPAEIITGTGQVPQVQGQPGGSFTGTGQGPIVVTAQPE